MPLLICVTFGNKVLSLINGYKVDEIDVCVFLGIIPIIKLSIVLTLILSGIAILIIDILFLGINMSVVPFTYWINRKLWNE